MADPVPGGRVPVPNALLGAQRGQQHPALPADQGAGAATRRRRQRWRRRRRHVRGQWPRAGHAAVVPAGASRPRRGLGPPARGRARAVRARRAGRGAPRAAAPVVLLPAGQRGGGRAARVPHRRVRRRLPERRGDRRGVHVRAVREVRGQRLDRHRTGVPARGRGLLAGPGVGHVAQVAPGAGHHGPETRAPGRLHQEAGRVHRRDVQRHAGHQALRECYRRRPPFTMLPSRDFHFPPTLLLICPSSPNPRARGSERTPSF